MRLVLKNSESLKCFPLFTDEENTENTAMSTAKPENFIQLFEH